MINGNRISRWIALSVLGTLAACSSSSGGGIDVVSAVQDLVVDPDGMTTRIVFSEDPGGLFASNFTASAGQNATSISKSGNVVQVNWDARVTRAHTFKVVSKSGVSSIPRAITTTDDTPPTFVITSAVQDTSDALLGGDTLTVTFTGARVIATEVVDPSSWTLTVDSLDADLTGSVFNFDENTQVLDVTLGAGANLHQNFTLTATDLSSVADVPLSTTPVAGVATGDVAPLTAPTVEQQLGVDPLGRVVDFTFNKPMDPVGSIQNSRFTVNDHAGSTTLTLASNVLQVADNVLRVTFTAPVVPGLDTVSLNTIRGYHGNSYSGTEAIANSSPAANAYSSVTATTVENAGGDNIVVVTDQAFDPDLAVDPAGWTLTVDGNPVTMADQTLSYDLSTQTLTIDLDFDMVNGDAVVITAVNQTDVDGEAFNGAPGFGVAAAGDANKPLLVSSIQNRTVDTTGQTVDVTFSEDLDPVTAGNPAFYAFSPLVTINTATLVGGAGRVVRLETAAPIVPGDYTATVVGLVADLAGETVDLGGVTPVAVATTDALDPAIVGVSANAVEGADNDTVTVLFNDSMIEAEVESNANWTVESPVGTSVDVSTATIDYTGNTATVTLDSGGLALKVSDSLRVTLTTMRDVGGRAIDATPGNGTVAGESNRPRAHTVWRDATNTDEVIVYFSEPCDRLLDLYNASLNPAGARFTLRDDDVSQTVRGYPISSQVLDGGLGVRLSFGFVVDLNDTLDVFGLTDLAGNTMFPVLDMDVLAEDAAVPVLGAGGEVTVVEGARNDTILVEFGQDMSPWRLLDPAQYSVAVTGGGAALDLTGARLELQPGSPTQVMLTLAGANVQFADQYDVQLNVDPANPLRTAQGVPIAVPDVDTIVPVGDSVEPQQVSSAALTDPLDTSALYVLFNEAVDGTSVGNPADYVFNGGVATGTAVTQVSPRVVRVAFDNPVTAGANLVIAAGSADLGGTSTVGSLTLAVTDDNTAPLLASVTPTAVENQGLDRVVVDFNELLDLSTALDRGNYELTNGVANIDLTGAAFTWDSVNSAVVIDLASGADLDVGRALTVEVTGVADVVGNTMGTVALGSAITGDLTPPTLENAFVNLLVNAGGNVADVLFSEDVNSTYASNPANWSASGGQTILAVETIDSRHYRISFVGPLGPADTLDITGVRDAAENVSGSLSIDPQE